MTYATLLLELGEPCDKVYSGNIAEYTWKKLLDGKEYTLVVTFEGGMLKKFR